MGYEHVIYTAVHDVNNIIFILFIYLRSSIYPYVTLQPLWILAAFSVS
jgi:hypothetical protein